MKRSEYISAFLDFVREAQIEYDVARMKQSEADSETQDILHRLELHDDSYHDMARLSKTLKEARQGGGLRKMRSVNWIRFVDGRERTQEF